MPICNALLKYGYKNFSLTILEFCDIENLMSKKNTSLICIHQSIMY